MSKLFVSGSALMSSSIQFMTTKCKTGSKKQTAVGSHKISRRSHHQQRASTADIAQSGSTEVSRRSIGSSRTKPVRSKVTFRAVKSSKSKPKKSTATEPTLKDSTSQDISLHNVSRENHLLKSTTKPRRETNMSKANSSLSAAIQTRGKTIHSTSTPSVSKKQASAEVHSNKVQGCPKANEKRKTVSKRQHGASGENLNASSSTSRHVRCTRRAAKTVSYTIRCSQQKSSNKNSGTSKSSRSPPVSRGSRVGKSVSPHAHLISFPKASLLKLTRRAATMSFRADSSVADNAPSTNVSGGGEAASEVEESLGPASYIPASSYMISTSNTPLYLSKSESKPRLKKLSRGGVVRTRIVRKKTTPIFTDGLSSQISQTGIYSSTVNPCDGGKLNVSQAISVVLNDSNRIIDLNGSNGRNRDKKIDSATPGNAAFSLASSSELMKSCSTAAPSKDLATSVSDSKTNSHKRRARASGADGGGHAGRQKVHVTRIRRSSARPPTNANNNADSPEDDEDDSDDKRKKPPQKNISDESSESDDRSSRESPESSEDKDSSSKSLTGTESIVEQAEPEKKSEIKLKLVKGVKKPSKHKQVKKTPIPKCPLFQGWDFGTELGEHSMARLPLESDLTAQLCKRAKYNIWESKGKPHNILSMMGSPITVVRAEHEDLKSYLARHSIDEFLQHLTSSVLIKPNDESAIDTVIEQGARFKQTLKFEQDTDGFLNYVFKELGDQPIAFPSITKSRSLEQGETTLSPGGSRTPVGRRSYKKSFDIVIGMPGLVFDPRLSVGLSARTDMEHRNTLRVGSDPKTYFGGGSPSEPSV